MKISKSSTNVDPVLKFPPAPKEGNVLFLNLWSRKYPSVSRVILRVSKRDRFEEETAKAEAKQQPGQ